MHLKRFTDFALRVLIYLALHPGKTISINEIARAFDMSRNHLLKVINELVASEMITTYRGKSGGIRLARDPAAINVGHLVRRLEGETPLINCNEPLCPILPACTLNQALDEAQSAFFEQLERYTLADLIGNKQGRLVNLLAHAQAGGTP
ncbi:Rrf2 family transcriptional regulator [Thiohalophilus thiocyanatoxydans]|uniref:BadM/Rrf2 family transcriptional regulator n=1 Tax=Thiohalophilus thiocyanatoxydans TaxID=381308 RepID=A0A4V3H3T5_9GAMM|nr:Rrf2 family transcriptional regulator [Thiohalophilus thiocyanatoxydans]TDY00525.1 BadM/Rrf2 family transcriptional regulator [Thiohalophilus thiocyanatoxydans]